MRFLLDANVLIEVLRGNGRVLARARSHAPEDVGVSAIVLHELYHGALKSSHVEANLAKVDGLRFDVVAFEREDARVAGEVRAALGKAGGQIGAFDVLIAAQALVRGLILVTHNMRELGRVAALRVEDWE